MNTFLFIVIFTPALWILILNIFGSFLFIMRIRFLYTLFLLFFSFLFFYLFLLIRFSIIFILFFLIFGNFRRFFFLLFLSQILFLLFLFRITLPLILIRDWFLWLLILVVIVIYFFRTITPETCYKEFKFMQDIRLFTFLSLTQCRFFDSSHI